MSWTGRPKRSLGMSGSDTVRFESDFTSLRSGACLPLHHNSSTTSLASDPSLTSEPHLRGSRLFESYGEVSSL
jgi:hypothetical protein